MFAIFTRKHQCWCLFLKIVSGLKAGSIIEKRLQRRCFSVNIAKYLRTPILKNFCERLLLERAFNKKQLLPGNIFERHFEYLRVSNIPRIMNLSGFRIMNMSGLVSILGVCWFGVINQSLYPGISFRLQIKYYLQSSYIPQHTNISPPFN